MSGFGGVTPFITSIAALASFEYIVVAVPPPGISAVTECMSDAARIWAVTGVAGGVSVSWRPITTPPTSRTTAAATDAIVICHRRLLFRRFARSSPDT